MTFDRAKYQAAYLRRYRNRRRRDAISALGGKCEQCGSKSVMFVRKNPYERSQMNKMWSAPERRLQEELSLSTLLCDKCWRDRRREHGLERKYELTHGLAYAVLKKKCQCEICADPELVRRLRAERNEQAARGRQLAKSRKRTLPSEL